MKALYAFSGDPITYGHIDIIKRASKIFDEVIVEIGENPDKKYMFDIDTRLTLTKKVLETISNVTVIKFSGLLVDYAYEYKIPVIIRGIRNSADYDYENNLFQAGKSLGLGIETFTMFASPEYSLL
jgi:pantetheine-phosphate adenylyltransferase